MRWVRFARASPIALVGLGGLSRVSLTQPTDDDDGTLARSPTISSEYRLGRNLGQGGFATVREGRHRKTGKRVAVKIVPKGKSSEETVRREVKMLQRVSMHRSIASLEAFYETPTAFYIVMELVDGGELFDRLLANGTYSERDAIGLLRQVCGALALLHAQNICHADIKPENLLLTREGSVKVLDLTLSLSVTRALTLSLTLTLILTPTLTLS